MDQDQAIVWQAHHDPFGRATVTTQTVEHHLRFPGQYFDAETGLHYNYFRDYDPSIGRYVQSDPIGLNGGINTYVYVRNNPLNRIDPFGLAETGGTIGGMVGGTVGDIVGGIIGGGSGTIVCSPTGVGAIGCGAIGASEGAAMGAAAGVAAGAAIGNAVEDLCKNKEEECDMELIGERPSFDRKTYTCVYKSKGNIFTFPQAVGYACPPVDKKCCRVDTSYIMPPARY